MLALCLSLDFAVWSRGKAVSPPGLVSNKPCFQSFLPVVAEASLAVVARTTRTGITMARQTTPADPPKRIPCALILKS